MSNARAVRYRRLALAEEDKAKADLVRTAQHYVHVEYFMMCRDDTTKDFFAALFEVAARGVTVNTVSPGYIGTDMVRAIKPDRLEKIVSGIPVKRLGEPEEIASIVAWLASDESAFATGADFSLNGGLHMG